MKLLAGIGFCVLGLLAVAAQAAPILSVDADPGTAGIQSSISVAPGTMFSINIVVEGVESAQALQGFELDLGFDAAFMTALSVVEGGFLQGPFGTSVIEEDLAPPDVNFAVTALGVSTSFGDGILASINFFADTPGGGLLDLNDVILSAFPAVSIPLDGVNGASISVQSPGGTASIPGTLALFSLGICLVGSLRRNADRQSGTFRV